MTLVRPLALAGALALSCLVVATALAANGEPQKKLTGAGQARAKAVALRLADLGPGWKAERSKGGGGSSPRCSYYNPDQSDLVQIGKFDSPDFTRADGSYVSSTVGVFRTAAMARKGYERVVRPELPRCLAELFAEGTGAPTSVKIVSTGKLVFPRYRDRSAAFRVSATFRTSGGTVPLTIDVVAVNRGQIDVAMIFLGVGKPLPAAYEQSLAGKVAARMA